LNYKLLLQYDGTDFHGWQIQGELRTVQGELTRALSLIEGSEVVVHGSGRTDAGVHAEGQVASVVIIREISVEKLRSAINANIGKDLRVLRVETVDENFHARYSATGKTYLYRILNGPVLSPFWARYAYQEARSLDIKRMLMAAELLLGEHDRTAFSAMQSDVEDRRRTIKSLAIAEHENERAKNRMVEIKVTANGFLRYMVRTIAGALMAVGRGDLDIDQIRGAIDDGVRHNEIVTAPAHGLTLLEVLYQRGSNPTGKEGSYLVGDAL
jgi:tRNA pseudouridine38-40 synthase